ncbi:hypothetical protein [Macellibacteroides fermentans]|uniref:hypothetical protein n=1 Tax=Macellibacteroides fermentans TaxID=879969 RepID=UPI00406C0EAD
MILPYEEVGVVKIIRTTKRDFNGVNITGDIMYFRHLTPSYTFKKKEEAASDVENFNKNVAGIQQNTFPEDEIDNLILQAVRTEYPECKVFNKLILFVSERESLNYYKGMPQAQSLIRILPKIDHNDPSKWFLYDGKEIFTKALTIYVDWTDSSLFNNEAFNLYYDISHELEIKDMMKTFSQVVKPI